MDKTKLAAMIDHTILKSAATDKEIIKLCREAKEYGFASVCVNPLFVPLAALELKGSQSKVCTVVGFPLGANPTEVKAYETSWAVKKGAQEIDMVIAVGKLKSGEWDYVEADIAAVVEAASPATVKVILETCFLEKEEIQKACKLAEKAGADYVKTSTGFGSGGALVEDVKLMAQTVPALKVKASGGVRSLEAAIDMIQAGASRIGTSSGISLLQELS